MLIFKNAFNKPWLNSIALGSFMLFIELNHVSAASMSQYASFPMVFDNSESATPEVMLAMSNDHQLFFKAYTDYDDIDGDTHIDSTYKNEISYYGYFENSKCYEYDLANQRFVAKKFADIDQNGEKSNFNKFDKSDLKRENLYCNISGTAEKKYWSGNFLNWASMTRIDIVRKILYGGYRSTDTADLTVLERSYIPNDAHSFAKYYNGNDLDMLTPLTSLAEDGQQAGITFCNTTVDTTRGIFSQQVVSPPLLRVAYGNFKFWASSSRYQCLYRGADTHTTIYSYDRDSGVMVRDPMPLGGRELKLWDDSFEDLGASATFNLYSSLANDDILKNYPELVNAHHHSPSYRDYQIHLYDGVAHIETQNKNADQVFDLVVRVVACDNRHTGVKALSEEMFGHETCTRYGNHYKPEGLLQNFGEGDAVLWGLISGSYNKNKSGGVLRKNIGTLSDEMNADGTFKHGQPFTSSKPTDGGIISTLNALRIVDWSYDWDDNPDHYGTYNKADCWWGNDAFENGKCRNWGNPFGEILLESYRYFTDINSPIGDYTSDDSQTGTSLNLLQSVSWNHDASTTLTHECTKASYNVIGLNSSVVSYDSDEMSLSTLTSAAAGTPNHNLDYYTNLVGTKEGINNSIRFVGDTVANSSAGYQCTAKFVSHLSEVSGVCPDAARLQGSYLVAGAAYFAKNYDINPAPGKQTITTHGIALAPALPKIEVPVPDASGNDLKNNITIMPACRDADNNTSCAIVDMHVLNTDVVTNIDGTKTKTGSFYILWEDSEQGGDFDQDLAGILSYEISTSSAKIQTRLLDSSASGDLGFGFVINGVSAITDFNTQTTGLDGLQANGFHVTTGINNYHVPHQSSPKDWGYATFIPSVINDKAFFLETPLYYAAKWGGYRNLDSGGLELDEPENWDQFDNNNGAKSGDRIPDNYHKVINPIALETQLSNVLSSIVKNSAVSRGTGIVSNAGEAAGMSVQALYEPEVIGKTEDRSITWVGKLNAYFKDELGLIREDSNQNGRLDNPTNNSTDDTEIDKVIRFEVVQVANAQSDSGTSKMRIYRYNFKDYKKYLDELSAWYGSGQSGDEPSVPEHVSFVEDVEELSPIWNAQKELRLTTQFTKNRTSYGSSPRNGRYILTGIDKNANGQITNAEVEPFTVETFKENDYVDFLDIGEDEEDRIENHITGRNLIDYIRGVESDLYRSRTIDNETWYLGDIVHSTPQIVAAPSLNYDIEFGDESYAVYRERWKNRRQVVYVGANDGMLHAFNAGKCNLGSAKHASSRLFNIDCSQGKETSPLGGELWAYIPYSALPHLKWLSSDTYSHVSYVDGEIKQFDVNIFPEDADHPGGWGTIIVAGMRLGGGPYSIENPITGEDQTLRSSYIIMDVTNPDKPPKLISEFSVDGLGFTTASVDIVKYRALSDSGSYDEAGAKNKWYLAFASGATGENALSSMESNQNAKLFLYDLQKQTLLDYQDTNLANSFVGGVNAMDWNRDYKEDAIYFGTVSGTIATQGGSLGRQNIDFTESNLWGNLSNILNVDKPFSVTPLTANDANQNHWVIAGTGRLLVSQDGQTISSGEAIYALKERFNDHGQIENRSINIDSLANITDAAISKTDNNNLVSRTDGTNGIDLGLAGAENVQTRNDVENIINRTSVDGWYEIFPDGQRNHVASVMNLSTLYYATYSPSSACNIGDSYIYARDLSTGLPEIFPQTGLSLGGSSDGIIKLDDVRITALTGKAYADSKGGESSIETPQYKTTSKRMGWRESN